MHDESFIEMPEINLYNTTLFIFERAANSIKAIIFNWNDSYFGTSGKEVKMVTLPEKIKIKPDPSRNESNRKLLAQNICQKLQNDKQMVDDSSQKITDQIVKEVQQMTRVNN